MLFAHMAASIKYKVLKSNKIISCNEVLNQCSALWLGFTLLSSADTQQAMSQVDSVAKT